MSGDLSSILGEREPSHRYNEGNLAREAQELSDAIDKRIASKPATEQIIILNNELSKYRKSLELFSEQRAGSDELLDGPVERTYFIKLYNLMIESLANKCNLLNGKIDANSPPAPAALVFRGKSPKSSLTCSGASFFTPRMLKRGRAS